MHTKLLRLSTSLFLPLTAVTADFVFNEKLLNLTHTSVLLSKLAYEENPPGDGYDHFGFYDDEPDQAIVTEKGGYCFVAFRGTTMTFSDWFQNMRLFYKEICNSQTDLNCCTIREGFYDAYFSYYRESVEAAVRDCAKSCSSLDECVVLTGHSQGGAIAVAAAVALSDLNPYVITFGQPRTIETPCSAINSERFFRFVNTMTEEDQGILYDPIPFIPSRRAGDDGRLIVLGGSSISVAYVGIDITDDFAGISPNAASAHFMVANGSPHPGYVDRINDLIASTTVFPIPTDGYPDHSFCSQSIECQSKQCGIDPPDVLERCIGTQCTKDSDCPTFRCDAGSCRPKRGSCELCDEDSDCTSGSCLYNRCTGSDLTMDDGCVCATNSDCASGRCETVYFGDDVCEAQLGMDVKCNEHTDCRSGYCSWSFQCEKKKKEEGQFCASGSVCNSGSCSWFRCQSVFRNAEETTVEGGSGYAAFGMVVLVAVVLGVAVVKYVIPRVKFRRGYEEIRESMHF